MNIGNMMLIDKLFIHVQPAMFISIKITGFHYYIQFLINIWWSVSSRWEWKVFTELFACFGCIIRVSSVSSIRLHNGLQAKWYLFELIEASSVEMTEFSLKPIFCRLQIKRHTDRQFWSNTENKSKAVIYWNFALFAWNERRIEVIVYL